MKFLITTLIASFLATSTLAETINVVNPGSEEGGFRQLLTTIVENLDHRFIQANNPVTAFTHLNNNNVLTMWSSEWPGNNSFQSPNITEKNIVALQSHETIMCSRTYRSLEEMSGQQVRIASWGSVSVARFLNNLEKEFGTDFVVVPYDGSGSMIRGYIGGDADTIFTISSRQGSVEEDPNTVCFASSANNDLRFRFVDAVITVNADTKLTRSLRSIVNNLHTTEEWNNRFTGTVTYVDIDDNKDILEILNEAVENFKP